MMVSFLTLFLITTAFLSYEILLMRLLNIIAFSHFASMVVSLAMLGLGFSGCVLALFPHFFHRRKQQVILFGCFLFSVSVPLCFYLNQKLPLNYLYLIWDWRQFLYLGISYLLYGIPFLIVAIIIALFFLVHTRQTAAVYAVNMAGSGCGILMAIGFMYLLPPENYLMMVGLLSATAGLIFSLQQNGRVKIASFIAFGAVLFFQLTSASFPLMRYVSEYKGLPGMLRLPKTEITHRFYNPLGLTHALKGETIRLAPGLSLNHTQQLPSQKAITVDAGAPSAVIDPSTKREGLSHFDSLIYSSVYHLLENPSTLIIGAGGGADMLLARYYNSRQITVLEVNEKMIDAQRSAMGKKAFQDLYKGPDIQLILREARGFLEETHDRFDLIRLDPLGTLAGSAAGVHAQNEDYLNTLEAYQLVLDRLSNEGVFMASRWMKTPARDGLKLFYTGFDALKRADIKRPEKHLALLRNWDIITLLIKKAPFTPADLQTLRAFAHKRNFDIAYLPGVKREEVNRFHKLPEPVYYQGATAIIDGDSRKAFTDAYPFDIKPATDDKPYFGNFIRFAALGHLIRTTGKEWLPFMEYGFLVVVATLVQAGIIGGILIIVPMAFLLRRDKERKKFPVSTWVYFCLLGISYMFMEMALIQKFILFLHHPIYSTSAVVAAFLLLSGLGSFCSERFIHSNERFKMIPFAVIILLGASYAYYLDAIFSHFIGLSLLYRFVLSIVIISPLAFFMGMPFPIVMQRIVPTGETNTGAAWGFNGFFSVVATVSTPFLAFLFGFQSVILLACCGYLIASWIWSQMS